MSEYQKILEDFKRDTANHSAEILLNNGLYRHIRFSRNGSSVYHFNLTTWPGYLCISGDMGCYVFSRITDMFGFFPMDDNDFNKRSDGELSINPCYWSEKLQSGSGGGRGLICKEWCSELFEKEVNHRFEEFMQEQTDLDDEDKAESIEDLRQQIDSVLAASSNEYEAVAAIHNFDNDLFEFVDFWECDFTVYTHHYIWCCYAIVWGIQEFKKLTSKTEEAA